MDQTLQQVDAGEIQYRFRLIKDPKELRDDLADLLKEKVSYPLPEEVKVSAVTEKRANPIITLESCDKQLIGQVAAKIRSFRRPEPYKGKGIRFVGEQVRRKAGKSAKV